jgi:hypothetical protein
VLAAAEAAVGTAAIATAVVVEVAEVEEEGVAEVVVVEAGTPQCPSESSSRPLTRSPLRIVPSRRPHPRKTTRLQVGPSYRTVTSLSLMPPVNLPYLFSFSLFINFSSFSDDVLFCFSFHSFIVVIVHYYHACFYALTQCMLNVFFTLIFYGGLQMISNTIKHKIIVKG